MAAHGSGQQHNPKYATFALNLASNENLLMVLKSGSTAQARRRRSASSTAIPLFTVTPDNYPSAVSDGYQSSDDSLHLPRSTNQRRARPNTHFLPPLPGHPGPEAVAFAGPHGGGAPTPSISLGQVPRRNSASSISSAFSWQESIFHVRRLSDARNGRTHAPNAPRAERTGRSLVPPPRHGSRPHPSPLRSNPVLEGGWI